MDKLQEIKQKTKDLLELINDYESEFYQIGINEGKQQVYDRICHALVQEVKKHGDLTGISVQDIPSADRILTASDVVRELFPDLNI